MGVPVQPIDLLKRVKEGWTPDRYVARHYAVGPDGASVEPNSPGAVRFCLFGICHHLGAGSPALDATLGLLEDLAYERHDADPLAVSDKLGHAAAVDLVGAAIERLEAPVATA
jgi:hypothetical protein